MWENADTIWRKSSLFHQHQDRWQQPANTLEYESFPGMTTPNMSSARIVARSLTPKSFATWRLKRPPNQNLVWKMPEALTNRLYLALGLLAV